MHWIAVYLLLALSRCLSTVAATSSLPQRLAHNQLERRSITFPLDPARYAAQPVPSLEEFEQLWASWDLVSQRMILPGEISSKPISLRNCCIFYLGHIPTFLDIYLSRATNGVLTEPSSYSRIFERGIDPDVENPALCHAHSEIPEEWPPVDEILAYQDRVRKRTRRAYENLAPEQNHKLGRTLWMCFEHEAMHLETLLYMLLQSDKTVPPPGARPGFRALAEEAKVRAVNNQWFLVPDSTVTVGMNDPENNSPPTRFFGWDNEKPQRSVKVPAFRARGRAITNAEYARYLEVTGKSGYPASWTRTSSGVSVRTVYGPVPLKDALHWPVMASYDELSACAKSMGGRIPTHGEVISIYNYADKLNSKDQKGLLVQGSSLSGASRNYSPNPKNPRALFANLEGCNVGFQHFHPMPITQDGNKLSGRAEMGGVWEWTSSVLENYKGFIPSELYPNYTADFFDRKHNIMLGGSWATHPRIAGRKSFINFFQRNYLYMWTGARVVRDA